MVSFGVMVVCTFYLIFQIYWLLAEKTFIIFTSAGPVEFFIVLAVTTAAYAIVDTFDFLREQDARKLLRRNAYKGR